MATFIIDQLVTRLSFERDDKAIDQVQRRLQSYRQSLNSMSQRMAIAGGALTAAGAVVGRTLLQYETSLNRLGASLGDATTEQLAALEEQARELGRTTSRSASEAVLAQRELAQAGFDVNQTLAATPGVLALSIASGLEMDRVALLLTNQLNSFGLSAEDADRVVDVLSETARSTSTTMAQLGPAFRQVGVQASNMGLSIEETAGAIAILRKAGLTAEMSGTGLRNVLARLAEVDPPASTIAGFRALGLNFDDIRAQVERGDFIGALQRMQSAGLNVGRAMQIFGVESGNAALTLVNGADAVDDFTQMLYGAKGAADEMRETMESGLPGAFAEFKSAVDDVQLTLGDSGLLAVISKVLRWMTGLARAFSDAPGPVKAFGAIVLVTGPLLLGLGVGLRVLSWSLSGYSIAITTATWLTTAWNQSNTILRLRLAAIAVWQGIVTAATWAYNSALNAVHLSTWRAIAASIVHRGITIAQTALTWAAVAAQWALNIAMTANPIGLIILAIVALIAILVGVGLAIWHFRDDIVNAFNAALNWAREHWPLLVAILLGPFGIIIWAVWKWRDQVIGAIKGVIDWVKSAIDKVKGFFGGGSVDVNINDNTRRATARTPSAQPGSPEPLLPGAQRGRVPTFHQGGIMGENGPAILQRGEMVLPPGLTAFLLGLPDLLTNLLPMMAAGPGALLPAVSAPAPIINNSVNNFYASMNRDAVTVQVTVGSTDAADIREAARLTAVEMRREIAAIVPAWFRDAMSDLASDSDTTILR